MMGFELGISNVSETTVLQTVQLCHLLACCGN